MTDFHIDESTMAVLRAYADRSGQTPDQVVQAALERYLRSTNQSAAVNPPSETLLDLIGIGHSGQHDVSSRTNEILNSEIDPQRGWTFRRDGSD